MTLPASGSLTIAQIQAEIGDSFPVTIPNANWRTLAGKPTGSLVIPTDFHGKSWRGASLVHTSSSASEVAQYGTDITGRWIMVLALGGNSVADYDMGATISGVPGTIIRAHTSGDGSGNTTGTSIIVGQPSGTSGTVSITGFAGTCKFYVLRVTGYNCSSAVFSDETVGAPPPWSANVPANGLSVCIRQTRTLGGSSSWTNLTERIAVNQLLAAGFFNAAAWDVNMPVNAALSIGFSPSSATTGTTSGVIATFAAL